VDVILTNNVGGRASVPSGASTGTNEAVELRDNDKKIYGGKGVLKAVENVNNHIAKALIGMDVIEQRGIDEKMLHLDGTPNKEKLGANAILAVSLASADAAANYQNLSLFQYLAINHPMKQEIVLPVPMMNIINGGKHAAGSTDIQEFMIMPVGASSFSHALQIGVEIFHTLGKILAEKGYTTTVGDEGGYAPQVRNGNAEAIELILEAIEKAKYEVTKDVVIALDPAASEFFKDGRYMLKTEGRSLTPTEMVTWLSELVEKYPIVSIEDGLAESAWENWTELTKQVGNKIQIVGDDLLVTNPKFLDRAIREKAANAILVKPNQIGTLTETIETIKMAKI
jgi:enolase